MVVSKNKRNKNTEAGFIPIRRGIYEHLRDGRMSGKEWMVYTVLHLKADHLTGICPKISAPILADLLQINTRMANRILTKLEEKGYIRRLNHRGQVSFYPVVINKFLTSSGLLIDAYNTKSLNEIAFYVERDCLLTVFQVSFKCLLNVLYTRSLKEIKNITISSGGKKPPSSKPPLEKYNLDSPEFKLSSLLLDLIIQRKPDYREGQPNRKDATLQRWVGHIDKMIRIDNRKPDRIEAVIRWCQQDAPKGERGFGWQDNILSTSKLREKFDKLELAMQASQKQTQPRVVKFTGAGPSEEFIKRQLDDLQQIPEQERTPKDRAEIKRLQARCGE